MPQGYVYPIRSLLSGIQAAPERNTSDSVSKEVADPYAGSHKTSPHISSEPLMESTISDLQLGAIAGASHGGRGEGESSSMYRRLSTGLKRCMGLRRIDPLHYKLDHGRQPSRKERKRVPNFVDYPTDQDPLAPRSFVSGHISPPPEPTRLGTLPGPMGEPVPFDPQRLPDDPGDYILRRPQDLSDVAADAFADATEDVVPPISPPATDLPHISNFSQSGIVHLAPIDRDGSPSLRTGSSGSGSAEATSRAGTSGKGSSSSNSGDLDIVQMPSTRPSRPHSPISAFGSGSANTSSQSGSGGSSSEGPHITFRYQHVEDENGHHLIVGREGTLTRCEDEPIRTPGAVQGFGVLVALQEDEETGNLIVRQVSEVLLSAPSTTRPLHP